MHIRRKERRRELTAVFKSTINLPGSLNGLHLHSSGNSLVSKSTMGFPRLFKATSFNELHWGTNLVEGDCSKGTVEGDLALIRIQARVIRDIQATVRGSRRARKLPGGKIKARGSEGRRGGNLLMGESKDFSVKLAGRDVPLANIVVGRSVGVSEIRLVCTMRGVYDIGKELDGMVQVVEPVFLVGCDVTGVRVGSQE